MLIELVRYLRRISGLVKTPAFILLSISINVFVLFVSLVFYLLEKGPNPGVEHVLDAVWWAFSTVTTVGYGDLVPVTVPGRLLGIFLMLVGTAFLAGYAALFANLLFDEEIFTLDKKINRAMDGMERKLAALERQLAQEQREDRNE